MFGTLSSECLSEGGATLRSSECRCGPWWWAGWANCISSSNTLSMEYRRRSIVNGIPRQTANLHYLDGCFGLSNWYTLECVDGKFGLNVLLLHHRSLEQTRLTPRTFHSLCSSEWRWKTAHHPSTTRLNAASRQ